MGAPAGAGTGASTSAATAAAGISGDGTAWNGAIVVRGPVARGPVGREPAGTGGSGSRDRNRAGGIGRADATRGGRTGGGAGTGAAAGLEGGVQHAVAAAVGTEATDVGRLVAQTGGRRSAPQRIGTVRPATTRGDRGIAPVDSVTA